jgi:hypothetical protein
LTYFKMRLQGQKGPRLDARVCYQALTHFQHPPPVKRQDQPYLHAKQQRLSMPWQRTPPPLDKAGKKLVKEVCGVFLFLARGVDGSLLPALSTLASQQANPTEQTPALCKQFLDYMASQDKAVLTYKESNMVLAIHSDASYLSKPKARSHAGRDMFMAGRDNVPTNNGAVLNIFANNTSSHVICRGGRTWRLLHQCKHRRLHAPHAQRTRPPPPTNTNANR